MSKSKYCFFMEKLHTSEDDWQGRFITLKAVQELVSTGRQSLLPDIQKHLSVLSRQLLDSRSKIVKETSIVLIMITQTYGRSLIMSDVFLKEVLKGMSSANTVLREYVYQTVVAILVGCQSQRCVTRLLTEMESKNTFVREKISECLLIVVNSYNLTRVGYLEQMQCTIIRGLSDKVQRVRKNMRKVYIKFQERCPEVRRILSSLDPSIVRLIDDERTERSQAKDYSSKMSYDSNKENQFINSRAKIQKQTSSYSIQMRPCEQVPKECSEELSEQSSSFEPSSVFASHILPVNLSRRKSLCKPTKRINQQKRQDIQFLVSKAQSSTWNTRLMSLQKLIEILQTEEYSELLDATSLKIVILTIVKRLEDTHQKVSTCAVQGLTEILPYFSQHCLQHSFIITKRCVRGIAQKNKKGFENMLSIMKSFFMIQVFNSVVRTLQLCRQNQKLVCLDLMIEMLQFHPDLLQSKQVGHVFKMMTNIISETKTTSIPALAVISILKNNHPAKMWSCFINLSDSQLSRMIELAGEIDPSLESVIVNFTKSNPRTNKFHDINGSHQKELSLLNVSQLESLSSTPEFINEYVALLHSKVSLKQSPCFQRLLVMVVDNPYLNEYAIYQMFDMLHISSIESVLISVNKILDQMILEPTSLFIGCLLEVVSLASGIHLEMYLQKVQTVVVNSESEIEKLAQKITQLMKTHLQVGDVSIRRRCILILARLAEKSGMKALACLGESERRLVQRFLKTGKKEQRRY